MDPCKLGMALYVPFLQDQRSHGVVREYSGCKLTLSSLSVLTLPATAGLGDIFGPGLRSHRTAIQASPRRCLVLVVKYGFGSHRIPSGIRAEPPWLKQHT
jgi:hypothetical protein